MAISGHQLLCYDDECIHIAVIETEADVMTLIAAVLRSRFFPANSLAK
jgi:hypothetical protein